MYDELGFPAARQELEWGIRIQNREDRHSFTSGFAFKRVFTDGQGRFTLPALIVGQRYFIDARTGRGSFLLSGVAEPQKPGPMDLGTLVVGGYPGDLTRPVPPSTQAAEKAD